MPHTSCNLIQTIRNQRSSYPIDAANAEDSRKLWLRPNNLKAVKYDISPMPENVSIDVIRERYGMPSKIESSHPVGSLEEAVHFLLHASMHIMSRDGYALPFVFARESNGEKLRIIGLQAEDRVGKHIAIRQAASVLSRIPIDWAVQVSEAWTAIVDPKKPLYRHAADDPDRGECIAVSGVSATGQFCNARVDFTRLGKKIVFGKESNDKDPVNIMVPIAKAIARKS